MYPGLIATCSASSPSDIDLGCGFHDSLSLGTRSRTRRVVAFSTSSSPRIAAIDIEGSFPMEAGILSLGLCDAEFPSEENHFRRRPCFHAVTVGGKRFISQIANDFTSAAITSCVWQRLCSPGGEEYAQVARSHPTARWVGLTAFIVFAAAVASGVKLWHKAPIEFFLPPTTEADASAEPAPLGPSPFEAPAAGVTAGTSVGVAAP